MEVGHSRCAGMDISKRDAKVCIRIPGPAPGTFVKTVKVYSSTYAAVTRLRNDLVTADVTMVVMEATGDYWKPFYYQFEGSCRRCWSTPATQRIYPAAKPTSLTHSGWPNSARTAWSDHLLSRLDPSESYGT